MQDVPDLVKLLIMRKHRAVLATQHAQQSVKSLLYPFKAMKLRVHGPSQGWFVVGNTEEEHWDISFCNRNNPDFCLTLVVRASGTCSVHARYAYEGAGYCMYGDETHPPHFNGDAITNDDVPLRMLLMSYIAMSKGVRRACMKITTPVLKQRANAMVDCMCDCLRDGNVQGSPNHLAQKLQAECVRVKKLGMV